jgi:predicted RND superfamily exporter protein
MDYAILILAFVGLVVVYGLATALVRAAALLTQKPWIALIIIAMLSAALLAGSSRETSRADYASYVETSERSARTLRRVDQHDL